MKFQITLRHGKQTKRYHTLFIEAENAVEALRLAPDGVPEEIVGEIDLIELRTAPDPEKERPFLEP